MKQDLLRKIGSMEQLAYVRRVVYRDGKCNDMKVIEVKAGECTFSLAEDKCLDMIELTYRGQPLHFLSKSGIQNVQHYDNQEEEGQRSMMGGMFFTCGVDNVGSAAAEAGRKYPLHGKFRSTPATKVCTDAYWEEDKYKIRVSGEIRQGEMFHENIVLRRSVEIVLGSSQIKIHDEFENQGFKEEPFMLLYHFNVGYPLVNEGSKVAISSTSTKLRGEEEETKRSWKQIEAPEDLLPEEVFYHKFDDGKEDKVFGEVYNETLNRGFRIEFNRKQLPYLTQWKSMTSGDYAMGLEPCNCHVQGRVWEREHGSLKTIAPFEKKEIDLLIELI